MRKRKILILDSKNVFFKMFSRKLKNQIEFIQNDFFSYNNKRSEFESLVFVIHNQIELIKLFDLYKKGTKVLICVFNQQLASNLLFLQETEDFTLLNASRLGNDVLSDLKLYFELAIKTENKFSNTTLYGLPLPKNQLNEAIKNSIIKSIT